MKKITIINGANLNLLGTRETDIYGQKSFEDYLKQIAELEDELNKQRMYKGTDAIHQGDNWHDNPTLYQAEMVERNLMLRIREMKNRIPEIEIVERSADDSLVEIGDVIKLDMIFSPDDIDEQILKLVGGNPNFGGKISEISINSPIGAAIYHKQIGDSATYQVNDRQISVIIKEKVNLELEEKPAVKKL